MLVQFIGVDHMARRAPAAVRRAQAMADDLVRALAQDFDGTVADAAFDGTLLRFPTTRDAVSMSLRLQAGLLTVDWPQGLALQPEAASEKGPTGQPLHAGLRARVAIHSGWVAGEFGRTFGPGAYQLARIASVGSGGQTLVSEPAWRGLSGRLPGGTVVRDLGSHRLPGVHGRSRLFQVLPASVDARLLPPLATSDRSNVPPPTTAILGREGDLLAVAELYTLGVRLVTVVGPEGIGRRRFVEQLARHPPSQTARHGGARLVRPGASDALELVRATGSALGVPTATAGTLDRAVEQVGHALASLGPVLLAFEGQVDALSVLEVWLDLAPELRLLLQGPEPKGAAAEVPFRLRDLPTPSAHAGRHDDAVRIYSQSADRVSPGFELHDALDATIIAQAVGGRPHALQLAGSLADRMPPARLAAQVLGRQMNLVDLIELALDHLTEEEYEVLEACAAVPSAFEDELIAWMLQSPEDLRDTMAGLRDRGLLVPAPSAERPHCQRWQVERNVQHRVTLRADPERLANASRRAAEGLVSGAELWLPYTLGPHRAEVLARLAMDAPGLLAVATRRLDDEQAIDVDLSARAVAALQPVLRSRGPLALERHMQDQVLSRCDRQLDSDPIHQSRLLLARANGTVRAGRQAMWEVDLARARSLVERWDDADGQARLALIEGRAARSVGHAEAAMRHLSAARDSFLTLDDPIRAAVAEIEMGAVSVEAGNFVDAEELLQSAQRRLRGTVCPHIEARALATLATLYRRTQRPASARSTGREALRIYESTGSLVAGTRLRRELALLDYQLARYREATEGLHEAVATARTLGNRRLQSESLYVLALVALARREHGEARRVMLEALALARDQQDQQREGEITGLLGVVHHLDEQAEAAREFYRRATRILARHDQGRQRALFLAWWAALEIEQGAGDEAQAHFAEAEQALVHSHDPEVTETLRLLRRTVVLLDEDDPEAGRQALRKTLRGIDPRSLSGQGRLAFRRVRRLASRGLAGTERPEQPRQVRGTSEPEGHTMEVSEATWEVPQRGGEQTRRSSVPPPPRREGPAPPASAGEVEFPEDS